MKIPIFSLVGGATGAVSATVQELDWSLLIISTVAGFFITLLLTIVLRKAGVKVP